MRSMVRFSATAAALVLVLLACSCSSSTNGSTEDASDGVDGAADADRSDSSGPVVAAIEPPRFESWTCPDGWVAETLAVDPLAGDIDDPIDYQICLPPAQRECARGAAQFLGEASCARIGPSCPTALFADEASIRGAAPGFTGTLRYVDPTSAGGDGSRAAPYSSIKSALAAAMMLDVIVLAKGAYQEEVRLGKNVALVGSCVDETVLSAPDVNVSLGTVIAMPLVQVLLANLSITGGRIGVIANQGSHVALNNVELIETTASAMVFGRNTSGDLRDVVIRDTQRRPDGSGGLGIKAGDGTKLSLSRVVLSNNHDNAVLLLHDDPAAARPRLEATDLVIRETQPQGQTRSRGDGIAGQEGIELDVERALFLRNRSTGMTLSYRGASAVSSQVRLVDVVVRETLPDEATQDFGVGIAVTGTELSGERILLEENRSVGLYVHQLPDAPTSDVTLKDLVVRDTGCEESSGERGSGVISLARSLVLERGWLQDNRTNGITATQRDRVAPSTLPKVTLRDLVVADTDEACSSKEMGFGVTLAAVDVEASRLLCQGSRDVGLFTTLGRLQATDLWVRDTRSNAETLFAGHGVHIIDNDAQVERLRLERNREAGIFISAMEKPSRVVLRDVRIDQTLPAGCAEASGSASCAESETVTAGGSAVIALANAELEIERFDISRSFFAGVQLGSGAKVALSDGAIHHNEIGANVQIEGYDLSLLTNPTVRYHDNQSNLVTKTVPVPKPVLPKLDY